MEFKVRVKNVYGNELVYPANLTAVLFARMLKVKTFNAHQLSIIKELGYSISVENGNDLPFAI